MDIVKALISLKNNEPFVIIDEDRNQVTWDNPEIKTPTQKQIDDEIIKLTKAAEQQAIADQAAADAAYAHAKSLGFTDDMLRMMFPNYVIPRQVKSAAK